MDALHISLWAIFGTVVIGMLALDLFVLHRKAHEVKVREAAVWSAVWVAVSLAFAGVVYALLGAQQGTDFLTAYVVEKSLSADNIFVFAVIFSYFVVPTQYQHRVLFWGVVGAIVTRGLLITAGVALLESVHWTIYIFGGLLIATALRLGTQKMERIQPDRNLVVRLVRRLVPVYSGFEGQRFFTKVNGRGAVTVLFVALVVVETTDLIFAIDSVPAVLAITRDPIIAYTSNVFAILGMRALYFLLAGSLGRFRYLKPGLAVVLLLVGVKLVASDLYQVPSLVSLAVVSVILLVAVAASLLSERVERPA